MLTKHKYISHKEVRCEECDKSYSRAVYIRHMRTVHVDKSNRTFKCDLCPYTSHAARYDFVSLHAIPELLQEGIFFLIPLFFRDVLVMKTLEIKKNKPTFIISVLKVEY